MDLLVRVDAKGEYWQGGAVVTVAEPLVQAFAPLRTGDVEFISPLLGEAAPCSAEVKRTLKLREEAAAEIAQALTRHLLGEMAKLDTHNGCARHD